MQVPQEYKYSKEHTWLKIQNENEALIGITEFAQSELGEIVYVDLPSVGSVFKKDEVFGSVEAIKTTSDLFMTVSGEVLEVNSALKNDPTLVNFESYTKGWMIRIKVLDAFESNSLLDATGYQAIIG